MYEEGGAGFRDALVPSQDDEHVPVLDLLLLSSPSTAQQELAKLRHALHSWGCFQVSLLITSCHNTLNLENLQIQIGKIMLEILLPKKYILE